MGKSRSIPNKPPGAIPKAKKNESSSSSMMSTYAIVGIVVAVCVIIWSQMSGVKPIQNLIDADDEVLKMAIFGPTPYLFFCQRKTSPDVPKSFTELNKIYGADMGFAMVNCSQVLPSGVNMWDRFKLKREWRPAVFAAAPWMRPKQVPVKALESVNALKAFVKPILHPHATALTNGNELNKFCGFGKATSSMETCFVVVKGEHYTDTHAQLESKLIKAHPSTKVGLINAKKRRFAFEDYKEEPADSFAMKLHAIRNGTHHATMEYSPTWDYIDTFVTHALGMPVEEYEENANGGYVKLKEMKSKGASFRPRSAPTPPKQEENRYEKEEADKLAKMTPKERRERRKALAEANMTPEEKEERNRQRIERENKAREELEQQASAHSIFEEDEEEDVEDLMEEYADEDITAEDEDDEEEVIEL